MNPRAALDVSGSAASWQRLRFEQLDTHTLHDLLQLRSEVFVVEQTCVYLDIDGLDAHAETWHVIGHCQGKLFAAARILAGPSDNVRIGRVVVHRSYRRQGHARTLMQQALAIAATEFSGQAVTLSAQSNVLAFYSSLGFHSTSEPYLEDGIEHVDMRFER